jgi:hypothetical protein
VSAKVIGILFLCILSIADLLVVIIPAISLILGLGIDVPGTWARSARIMFLYSRPLIPLLVGILILILCGWGTLRLIRT